MFTVSFENLLQNHAFSDIQININSQIYYLHRAILAERSQYFSNLFKEKPALRYHEMTIPNECTSSLDSILKWIYSSKDFRLDRDNFCIICKLAGIFMLPELKKSLISWMGSNVDQNILMTFYLSLFDMKDMFPDFFSILNEKLLFYFEVLDNSEIAKLPFPDYFNLITNPKLIGSSFVKSESIVTYISLNSSLKTTTKLINPEQRNQLVDLYISIDWIVDIPTMFKYCKDREKDLIDFAALHFCRITQSEFSQLENNTLVAIISHDYIRASGNDEIIEKIEDIANSSTRTKSQNQALRKALERRYQEDNLNHYLQFWNDVQKGDLVIPTEKEKTQKLRVLVMASAFLDILTDTKELLLKAGFLPENVVMYNADNSTPSLEFFYQFDVIVTYTHFQFSQPSKISHNLAQYLKNGHGSLVVAYGFFRNDEWGCGDEELQEYLPFTRGNRLEESLGSNEIYFVLADEKFDENDTKSKEVFELSKKMMDGITMMLPGKFSPRADISLKEGAHLVASYPEIQRSKSIPFLAYKNIPKSPFKVVGINMYPLTTRVHRFGLPIGQPVNDLLGRATKFSTNIY